MAGRSGQHPALPTSWITTIPEPPKPGAGGSPMSTAKFAASTAIRNGLSFRGPISINSRPSLPIFRHLAQRVENGVGLAFEARTRRRSRDLDLFRRHFRRNIREERGAEVA